VTASVLEGDSLDQLRQDARREAGPFVDPRLLARAERAIGQAPQDWLFRVLGHPILSRRQITWSEAVLILRASEVDADHLAALREERRAVAKVEADRRAAEAAEEQQRQRADWLSLANRLPVPVTVWHNWTARHLDGYQQGADHIVVLGDLAVGRLQRPARHPLCWTPSRDHELRHVFHNSEEQFERLPNCKACLKTAGRF
jgi:hypothetical protein